MRGNAVDRCESGVCPLAFSLTHEAPGDAVCTKVKAEAMGQSQTCYPADPAGPTREKRSEETEARCPWDFADSRGGIRID